jgi:hypothetical protein
VKRQNGEASKLQDGANKRNINADAKLLACYFSARCRPR